MASDLLRENSTRNAKNFPGFAPNRFAHLRDSSPLSARSRSPSTKRKQFEGPSSYANAAKKRHTAPAPPKKSSSLIPPARTITISSENMEILEINSARVSSLCEKLHSAILAIPEENPICPILRDFCEIIHAHNSSHSIIAAALRSSLPLPLTLSQQEEGILSETSENACEESESEIDTDSGSNLKFVSLGAVPKQRKLLPSIRKSRSDWLPSQPLHSSQRASAPPTVRENPTPEFSEEILRFRESIKDAEKSTLVFNLDMGKVPVINQATMSVKATSALTSMAAMVEGRPPSNPSADSVAVIDDVLSLATKVSFFGSSTKSVAAKGALSGSYCTIPVCYSFEDKETRYRAEQALRGRCKVSCATPYPNGVRDCIKSALAAGKATNPDDFVRVKIDLPKLGLKLAWRAKDSIHWNHHDKIIPFPQAVLNNPSKNLGGTVLLENLPTLTAHNDSTLLHHSQGGSDSSNYLSPINNIISPPRNSSGATASSTSPGLLITAKK